MRAEETGATRNQTNAGGLIRPAEAQPARYGADSLHPMQDDARTHTSPKGSQARHTYSQGKLPGQLQGQLLGQLPGQSARPQGPGKPVKSQPNGQSQGQSRQSEEQPNGQSRQPNEQSQGQSRQSEEQPKGQPKGQSGRSKEQSKEQSTEPQGYGKSVVSQPNGPKGRSGRSRGAADPDVLLSKALSRTLRHKAAAQGIAITADGYCRVDDLLNHAAFRKLDADRAAVRRVLCTNNKKRFEFNEDESMIRAVQGHSLQVEVSSLEKLTLETLPPQLIHGTTFEAWAKIRSAGLSRMGRLHIHLASGLPQDKVVSGMRQSSQVYIYIDGPRLLAEGIEVYRAANGALVTPGRDGLLAPVFFAKVVSRDGQLL